MTTNKDTAASESSEFPEDRLVKVLQKAFETEAVPAVHAKRVDEGAGYMAVIAKVHAEWPEEAMELPERTVLKMPTPEKLVEQFGKLDSSQDSNNNALTEMFMDLHNREVNAYRLLAPKYRDQSPRKINIPMPMLYDSELATNTSPGYLLLEDMGDDAYIPDFLETLSIEQLESIIEWLAKYHAYTVLHKEDWEGIFPTMSETGFDDFIRSFLAAGTGLRQMYPDLFDFSDEELASLPDKEVWMGQNKLRDYPGRVLSHGDMWTNNLFYALKRDSGTITKTDRLLAIIDWQVVHPGLLSEDLGHLLAYSASPELRRANEERFLDLYYEVFERAVKAEMKPMPFTRKELTGFYREPTMFGFCAFGIMGHSALMLQSAYTSQPEERRRKLVCRAAAAVQDALVLSGKRRAS